MAEIHEGRSPLTWDVVVYPMDRGHVAVGGMAETVVENLLIHGASDAREVAEWVASAWRLAGGDRLPFPAFVAPRGYWQSVDVRSGRWIEDPGLYKPAE